MGVATATAITITVGWFLFASAGLMVWPSPYKEPPDYVKAALAFYGFAIAGATIVFFALLGNAFQVAAQSCK